MPRTLLRTLLILLCLLLAIFVPFLLSGYTELQKATTSHSYVETAQHYRNAAQRLPWRADLYELSADALYYAKEYDQADALYRTAFERGALSPQGWVAWGDVNYLNQNPKRATEIWEQALGQTTPSDQLYSRLAQIYAAQGDVSKEAQFLKKYVSTHPQDARSHYRLGLLLTLSDPKQALTELIGAAQLDPQLDPAVQTLRTALNLALRNDSPAERLVIVGRGLGLVNEWKLAQSAFQQAVRADANNAEAWAWAGETHQQLGADGHQELDRAVALDPESPTVRGLRGLYFQKNSDFRQALQEFQAASALDPKNPAWFVSIGESQAKLGDLIQALTAYQTATLLAPDDPSYWRLLAMFCGQNNVNVKDIGVPAAQKAVVLSNGDVRSLDVLGWLLLVDARYAESERILTQALKLDPQDASVHLHLGMLYLQMNNRASAYDHLVKSRDLGSSEAEMALKQYFP